MYIEAGWVRANETLNKLDVGKLEFLESGELGKYITLPLSSNDLQVRNQQANLHHVPHPRTPLKILEIGAGIGNFAEHLFRSFDVGSYTIVDTPTMLRFSKAFLNERADKCTFVQTSKYNTLSRNKFDLVVSCSCLSEVPEEHRKNLLKLALKTSKNAFIVDSTEIEFAYWLDGEMKKTYKDVVTLPYDHCQQVYIGIHKC